jgi:hypothetical protein
MAKRRDESNMIRLKRGYEEVEEGDGSIQML